VPRPGATVDVGDVHSAAARLGVDVDAMSACEQNPVHHGEGDVLTHTAMVLDAVAADPAWSRLDESSRAEVFVTALLHDAAKPLCAVVEDGVLRHPGHAHRGEKLARELLWRAGVHWTVRERVAQSIRFHLHPFFVVEREEPRRNILTIAESVAPSRLAILARGDAHGRYCQDRGELLASIALFEDLAHEYGCLDAPYPFASERSRFEYFTSSPEANRDPAYHTFDRPDAFEVLVTSGLPGSGKTTWLANNAGGPVISLDDIRTELKVRVTDNQRPVVALARERAKEFLRTRESFVWEATTLTRSLREELFDLLVAYDATIRVKAFETSAEVLTKRNRARSGAARIPEPRRQKMIERWEFPTTTECAYLDVVEDASVSS
jgi:predicted kinase